MHNVFRFMKIGNTYLGIKNKNKCIVCRRKSEEVAAPRVDQYNLSRPTMTVFARIAHKVFSAIAFLCIVFKLLTKSFLIRASLKINIFHFQLGNVKPKIA